MNILQAFGLVALGMVLEWLANKVAWMKYYEGRKDGRSERERGAK